MSKKRKDLIFGEYTISLIRSVLNNSAPNQPADGFDWQGFKKFINFHSLNGIVSYAVPQIPSAPSDVKAYYENIKLHAIAKEAQKDVEISELLDSFENQKIDHMVLKGYLLKHLYPYSNMRSMSDVDILIGSDLTDAAKVLSQHGFCFKSSENLHDSFFKKPFTVVELHKSLFDYELTNLYDYFQIGFERAKKVSGFNHRYELSLEDFYIFILAHFYKHFIRCGTGIRSVLDIYLYLSKYSAELDFDYIDVELNKIGLRDFNNKISSLAFEWFDSNKEISFDSVGEYIVLSGTYGKATNLELNRFLNKKSGKHHFLNKIKYTVSVLFPSLSYMGARYPVLKKAPILLPFFWLRRGVATIFKSRKSISYRLKGVIKSNPSTGDRFKDSGLN